MILPFFLFKARFQIWSFENIIGSGSSLDSNTCTRTQKTFVVIKMFAMLIGPRFIFLLRGYIRPSLVLQNYGSGVKKFAFFYACQ